MKSILSNTSDHNEIESLEQVSSNTDLISIIANLVPGVYCFAKDTQSRFIYVNQAFLDKFEIEDLSSVLGKTDFDFSSPEEAEGFQKDDKLILDGTESIIRREEMFMSHDKTQKNWMLTIKVPLHNAEGKIVGVVGMATNITEIVELKEQLKNLNETLESKVKDQVEKLNRATSLRRYLSPHLVDAVLEGNHDLEPVSKRDKITIFFMDIKGFTDMTDSLEPEEFTRLINNYLDEMCSIAFKYGGTIDKFWGDQMMVLFGAPEAMEPRIGAQKCVTMAIDMKNRMGSLRSF